VIFVATIGWRLVPARKAATGDGFATGAYLTELRVPKDSKAVGMTLREFEREIEADAPIVGLVRNEVRRTAPHGGYRIRADDVLVVEAEVDALAETLSVFGITLEEQKSTAKTKDKDSAKDEAKGAAKGEKTKEPQDGIALKDATRIETEDEAEETDADQGPERDEDIVLRELAVLPGSTIVGRSASDLRLRTRFGLNLLAIARAGHPPRARLRTMNLKSGDLLLVQGAAEAVGAFISLRESGWVYEAHQRFMDQMAVPYSAHVAGPASVALRGSKDHFCPQPVCLSSVPVPDPEEWLHVHRQPNGRGVPSRREVLENPTCHDGDGFVRRDVMVRNPPFWHLNGDRSLKGIASSS
jgi:Trk K+ transport system NAD-binding subunit